MAGSVDKGEARQAGPTSGMIPLDIRHVKVGGEIGRRIDMTVNANLLALAVDEAFLQPFHDRDLPRGYIGLGKLIDATVRFAAYTDDPRVLKLKRHLVAESLKTQEHDGYIGILLPHDRVWGVYDIHETSHIVLGLANDYRYFGERASLDAARKLADFTIARWSAQPDRVPGPSGQRDKMYGVTTGLDAAPGVCPVPRVECLGHRPRSRRHHSPSPGPPRVRPERLILWDACEVD